MIDISVIVPIYNAEKHLHNLINEIKQQTFKNYEVIFINDGSKDRTKEICEELIKNEENIKLIDQINQGPSVARNNGLSIAKGKYIIFLDSDDFIPNNMFQVLYESVEENKADLAIGEYDILSLDNEKIIKTDRMKTKLNDLKGKDNIIQGIINENTTPIFNYLWNKIYLRDIILTNNIVFNKDLRYAEDLLFNINYLKHVNNINIVHECVYRYCKRNQNKSLSNKYREDIYENSIQIIQWWKELLEYYNVDSEIKEKNINKQYINRVDILLRKIIIHVNNKKTNEILNKVIKNNEILKAYSLTNVSGINNKIIKFCIIHKAYQLLKLYLLLKNIIYKTKGVIE